MKRRGYKVDSNKFLRYLEPIDMVITPNENIFIEWHNDRYFEQCYRNLEEKYDCGSIKKEEWLPIWDLVTHSERINP